MKIKRIAISVAIIFTACVAAATRALPVLPVGVHAEPDIPYAGSDNPRQRLDLYLPETQAENMPLPLIVHIHGGGWQAGDKRTGRSLLPLVASGDFALASIGYRLTGEAIWPAQIHDCKAAIRWLRANSAKYGYDPDRICVAGWSAGGHLACLLGTSGGLADLEGLLGPHLDHDSRVACVINNFGPTDFSDISQASIAGKNMVTKLLGGTPQEVPDVARAASPVTHATHDDPPILCIHGTADPLVPFRQSTKLDEACAKAGVECLVIAIQDGGHGGFRNPEVQLRTRQFLDKYLRDREGMISEEPIPADSGR
jgi:acetyl esterase/lipase